MSTKRTHKQKPGPKPGSRRTWNAGRKAAGEEPLSEPVSCRVTRSMRQWIDRHGSDGEAVRFAIGLMMRPEVAEFLANLPESEISGDD